MTRVHYFASQQPLTVQPLPDGSNIYNAPRGSVEEGYRAAFAWYKSWLEFLHYSDYTIARFDRMYKLSAVVKRWKLEQDLFPPVEPSTVNGLYPVPPPIQQWMWPWHFWLVWQIRRDLANQPSPYDLDVSIEMLDNLLESEGLTENELDLGRWPEDRWMPMPIENVALRYHSSRIDDVVDEIILCMEAQRGFFKTRALRYWAFKRPWKKLWLVMFSDPVPQEMEHKVTELQDYLNNDLYGSQLLEVHPVLPRQLREKADCCVISACGGMPWEESDMVLETWCGHIICEPCMMTHWKHHFDNLNGGHVPDPAQAGDWPCPFCRGSPGRLRDKVAIAQAQTFGDLGDRIADAVPLWQ